MTDKVNRPEKTVHTALRPEVRSAGGRSNDPDDVVIVSAVRTAVARGKKDGSLASTHPVELSALVMKEALDRAGVDPAIVDDVATYESPRQHPRGIRTVWVNGTEVVRDGEHTSARPGRSLSVRR